MAALIAETVLQFDRGTDPGHAGYRPPRVGRVAIERPGPTPDRTAPVEGDSVSRAEQVYAALKREILDWTLPPGTSLSEVELAARLHASRTPVRQSLQRLSQEGLVQLVHHKGAFVTGVSIPDIVELFQLRQALESYGARLAAGAEHREELCEFVPELLEARGRINATDNAFYYAMTSRLDERIIELAGNDRLQTLLRHVWEQAYRARRLAATKPERLIESVGEHIRIVEAIAAGESERAALVTYQHLESSLDHIRGVVWRRL
jgi:DNA-binding GntR family transcriptional regulator